jgi:fructose-1-phosphate kinase PfkB-like protein
LGIGLSKGEPMDAALKLAAACGAANAMTALAGHLHAQDVAHLQVQARVETL